jgi:hypothetical protein
MQGHKRSDFMPNSRSDTKPHFWRKCDLCPISACSVLPPRQPVNRGSATSLLLLIILVSLFVAVADALLLDWLDGRLERSYRV